MEEIAPLSSSCILKCYDIAYNEATVCRCWKETKMHTTVLIAYKTGLCISLKLHNVCTQRAENVGIYIQHSF